ncbi:hypothetical protein [Lacimicrobium sp. SS2-24]|uniref:hypothetical protein n=1 Tax=Lacimicrobium sp. SS2-24 TaxID=2005569 RepID=UPI000B4ACBE7|nr:hypothetical protein [Lacimicrobium sp. SS2-24]
MRTILALLLSIVSAYSYPLETDSFPLVNTKWFNYGSKNTVIWGFYENTLTRELSLYPERGATTFNIRYKKVEHGWLIELISPDGEVVEDLYVNIQARDEIYVGDSLDYLSLYRPTGYGSDK